MTRADIAETVNSVLVDEFEVEIALIRDDAKLLDDLELDSLDAVDLIVALEAAFGSRVPEAEAKKVRTVGDVYQLIQTSVVPS